MTGWEIGLQSEDEYATLCISEIQRDFLFNIIRIGDVKFDFREL